MKKLFTTILILLTVGVLLAQTPATIDVTVAITGTVQQKAAIYRKFALSKGWPEEIQVDNQQVPNTENAKAFTERYLEGFMLDAIRRFDGEVAAEAARVVAKDAIDTSVKGTKVPAPTPTPKLGVK